MAFDLKSGAAYDNNYVAPPPIQPKPQPKPATTSSQPNSQPNPAPGNPQQQPVVPQDTNTQFQTLVESMRAKLSVNQDLIDQKNKVFTQLYDRPLTPEEKQGLTPQLQHAIDSGDQNLINFEIRNINDQIKGRVDTLDHSIQYMSSAYEKDLAAAQTKKDNAQKIVEDALTRAGSLAFSLYPAALKRQVEKNAGLPSGYLDYVAPTINQNRWTPSSTDTGGYNLSSYNSDPSYSNSVASIASGIPTISDASSAQQYITSISPNSSITGDMVIQAAQQYGVDPQMMMALMQKESSIGTSPVAQQNNNYGGITWSQSYQDGHPDLGVSKGTPRPAGEGGNYVAFATPQQGVAAQAEWLSRHKVAPDQTAQHYADLLINGTITNLSSVPNTGKDLGLRDKVTNIMATKNKGEYTPLAARRYTMAANAIVDNYIKLPAYQLTAGGSVYLARIEAAKQTPGSISDQDLLDSLTKLNTGGNAISDAQVRLVTDGQSYSDFASVMANKFKNGGVLSDSQRQQLSSIATAIYNNYKKLYAPIYTQATQQLTEASIPKPFWTIPDLNKLSSQVSDTTGGASGGGQTNMSDEQAYQLYLKGK